MGMLREDFISPVIGITFLILFLVLVFIFHNFRAHAKMIILAYFNIGLKEKNLTEFSKDKKAGLWLTAFFLLVLSLLVYNLFSVTSKYFNSVSRPQNLFYCIGIVLFLYMFKYTFKKVLGTVFSKERLNTLCFYQLGIKDKAYGIMLYPLLLIYNFSIPLKEISLIIIISLSFIYLVLRWINGLLVGIKHGNIPLFYSFLYICTLEITPIAIVFRVFLKPIVSI